MDTMDFDHILSPFPSLTPPHSFPHFVPFSSPIAHGLSVVMPTHAWREVHACGTCNLPGDTSLKDMTLLSLRPPNVSSSPARGPGNDPLLRPCWNFDLPELEPGSRRQSQLLSVHGCIYLVKSRRGCFVEVFPTLTISLPLLPQCALPLKVRDQTL